MELVYLWVEDYKNIHEQGFNFSPKFTCDYNHKTNELSIDENDDYIENLFGENINVTAIVGKNGSGKSRLLNYLDSPYKDKNNKLWIYKKEEKYYCQYPKEEPTLVGSSTIEIEFTYDDKFFSNTNWIALDKNIGEGSLSYMYMDGIKMPSYISGRKNDYNMEQNSLFIPKYIRVNIEYNNLFYSLDSSFHFDILRLILKDNSTKYLSNFIKQELIDYKDDCFVSTTKDNKVLIYEKNEITNSLIESEKDFHNKEIVLYDRNRQKLVEIVQEIEKLHRKQISSQPNNYKRFQGTNKFSEFELALLIAFIENYLKRCQLHISSEFLCNELEELRNEISVKAFSSNGKYRILKNYMCDFLKKLSNKYNWDIFSYPFTLDELIVATEYINTLDVNYSEANPYIDIPINNEMKDNIKNIAIFQKIFQDDDMFMVKNEPYLRVFELDMINSVTQAKYETISDGEKQFLKFSVDLISLFENIHDKQSIMILADEIDNHLHPLWKKKVLFEAIEIFKQIILNDEKNINIHILFSTHSPFLISDVPKQNIIFLDTYQVEDVDVKNTNQRVGNCKVLKHNKVLEKEQTFGQDIHTLLSDSFFMKDGLMGEFAKSKINEIIDFHKEVEEENKKKESNFILLKKEYENYKTKFWDVQSIIGEDYLKQVIKNHLRDIENILLGHDEAKKEEIKRLREEADRLEKM